jgi:hypothetical protein
MMTMKEETRDEAHHSSKHQNPGRTQKSRIWTADRFSPYFFQKKSFQKINSKKYLNIIRGG